MTCIFSSTFVGLSIRTGIGKEIEQIPFFTNANGRLLQYKRSKKNGERQNLLFCPPESKQGNGIIGASHVDEVDQSDLGLPHARFDHVITRPCLAHVRTLR